MAGEETEESISVTLSAEVVDWLDEQADDTGVEREEYLRDLVSAYRSVAGSNGDVDAEIAPLDSASEVERQFEEQREEYVDLVEDVRERVIQVKRETDAKAPKDHDHPEIDDRVAEAREALERVEGTVASLNEAVTELEADLENGFENYEDVLRYLKDATEESRDHLDTLASALLEVRSGLQRVAAESAARTEADRLKTRANKHGFRRADCEECGSTVDLSLLAKARCPHCSSTFVDVTPNDGFFGSNELVTGSAPALEGTVDDDGDLTSIVEESTDGDREFEWHDESGDTRP